MSFGGKGKNRGGKTINGSKSNETINGYAVSYFKKFSKCNKPNCTVCSKEGGGHGPYWYKNTGPVTANHGLNMLAGLNQTRHKNKMKKQSDHC